MTNKELKYLIQRIKENKYLTRDETNYIIKALEQENKIKVLEKIRAEIMQLDIFYGNDYFSSNKDAMFKCNDILQILDKYEGENEDT